MNNTLLTTLLTEVETMTIRGNDKSKGLLATAKELGIKIQASDKKAPILKAIIKDEVNRRLAEAKIFNVLSNTWNKVEGAKSFYEVERWLNKLNATSVLTLNEDSRFDESDLIKIRANKTGKEVTVSIAQLIKKANEVKEDVQMQNEQNKPMSKEDLEMLSKISNAQKEASAQKEAREEYFKAKRELDRQEMVLQAQEDLSTKDLSGLDFFEKLVRLQNVAKYLQETRYARRFAYHFLPIEGQVHDFKYALVKRMSKVNFKKCLKKNRFMKYTFTHMYNQDIASIEVIVNNSFDTQELASNENFEKNTEFAKLVDNVLIKAGVFDYKIKDSEVNKSYQVADILLAEQVDIAYNNKCAYHNRETAKEDNNLREATKKQQDLIMNMVWKYRKAHGGASPKMPVASLSQITSSVLATAILEKYAQYVDMDLDMPSVRQAELLFKRFVKWNVANSEQKNVFMKKVMLELTREQASELIEVTFTDMWLITRYMRDNNLKLIEACFKVAKMQTSTRSSAVKYYQNIEFRKRVQEFNTEDDK